VIYIHCINIDHNTLYSYHHTNAALGKNTLLPLYTLSFTCWSMWRLLTIHTSASCWSAV